MVIKIYISGISGNKEVKKRQQRVLLILDSKNVKYEVIDIAEPTAEEAKDFMQNSSTSLGATIGDPNPRHALPPQIFNDDVYCGDYDLFDMANEIDQMETFLKLEPNSLNEQTSTAEVQLKNGDLTIEETIDKVAGIIIENKENQVPNEQEEDKKEKSEEKEIEMEKEEGNIENVEDKDVSEIKEETKDEGDKEDKQEPEKESSPEKSE